MPKPMTEQEYLERLSKLFEKIQGETTSDEMMDVFKRYKAAEFDLTIDYRLGTDFPQERRLVLFAIQEKSLQDAEELKAQFTTGTLSSGSFVESMQIMTQNMVKKYSSVLSVDEMAAFLDGDENTLRLPIMPEALQKI